MSYTTYNIFISHSWAYSEHYEKLIYFLNYDRNFHYKDYSIPKNDPIHNAHTDEQLKWAIKNQMQHASCVLILAGVYSTFSKWINAEIDIAKNGFNMPKKIIAVKPWGAERMSTVVANAADQVVNWNSNSIIQAIKDECSLSYYLNNSGKLL